MVSRSHERHEVRSFIFRRRTRPRFDNLELFARPKVSARLANYFLARAALAGNAVFMLAKAASPPCPRRHDASPGSFDALAGIGCTGRARAARMRSTSPPQKGQGNSAGAVSFVFMGGVPSDSLAVFLARRH